MPETRRVAATLLIFIVVMILIIVLAELGARIILWRAGSTVAEPAVTQFGYSAGGYGDLLPNIQSIEQIYGIRPYYLRTNSAGLRNIAEIDDNPEVFRILAVGDSFTYGYYVHNHEAYPARLEETLHQLLPGRYQVLNAAVPGYTISDVLSYLRDKGLALNPDLLVMGFYTNDIFDLLPQIRQYFAREITIAASQPVRFTSDATGDWLRNNSALYQLIEQLQGELRTVRWQAQVDQITPTIPGLHQLYQDITFLKPDHPDHAGLWQAYADYWHELIALLAEHNIPLVLVAFPDLAQLPAESGMGDAPQRFLARLTTETQTPFLDLLPIYRSAGDVQSLYLMYYQPGQAIDVLAPDAAVQAYYGDGHPSPYGHLVAARHLADLLISEGLVPPSP